MSNLTADKYLGCIIGGAVGDALGAPIEFYRLREIITEYGTEGVNDYIEFDDGIGRITDDTQMLLFTADGLLRSTSKGKATELRADYLEICYQSYQRWFHTQSSGHNKQEDTQGILNGWLIQQKSLYKRRAPGNTCLSALRNGIPGNIKNPINDSKGNGGIMRIAPVGLIQYSNPEFAFRLGAELAALTHGHPSGYLPAGFLSSLLAFIINGFSLKDSIDKSLKILLSHPKHEETRLAIESAIELYEKGNPSFEKTESLGGAWVGEEALAISLFCALSFENNFKKAIQLSINHSGDADSTGAITGNIVGLINGINSIPERWRKQLEDYNLYEEVANNLFTSVTSLSELNEDYDWGKKYPIKNS
ncbi:MAG: ADP-ribosylglycohydrolase family protein [Bacteroidota bacterium]|jgi:ADP-ribosylglycohydrolase